MHRRELMAALGGTLGLAFAGPALASPIPDRVDPADLGTYLGALREQLARVTARGNTERLTSLLAELGLPSDLVSRSFRGLALAAGLRALPAEAQQSAEAQALLDEEARDVTRVALAWRRFLRRRTAEDHRSVRSVLRDDPTFALDFRDQLRQAAGALGVSAAATELLDERAERVLWDLHHLPTHRAVHDALDHLEARWRAEGVDPDVLEAALASEATVEPETPAERELRQERAWRPWRIAAAIVLGIGLVVGWIGAGLVASLAGGRVLGLAAGTALVVLAVGGLLYLVVDLAMRAEERHERADGVLP